MGWLKERTGIRSNLQVTSGGYFGSYEWCLSDKYNPNNERHKELKWMIEIGDGLPDISTTEVVQ
eukprot:CAMPEP_0201512456 /NCGR_PEP_ID=MMETSP0161_2-20130828/4716_1 /ASSEMBLY_ACC=CAM_ASM_000251 /TAXON_ID=180227 /ORGANISM="Neoparamoeba aestuarina, Strain SoJaBio B1-5/56/2" /LENGTH=63 /DNA_ID=CAMNT_0047908319 /DNA_START=108 /DNA_END=299 /DNA_ORIENTATION=+